MDSFIKKYINELNSCIDNPVAPLKDYHEVMRRCINVLGNDLNIDENIFYWNERYAFEDIKLLVDILEYNLSKDDKNSNIQIDVSTKNKIFISHRTTDEKIARLLARYLVDCGAPRESVFISSLPGNDVKFEISKEVKENLQSSALNIVLLSSNYYKSAYCQNEAGIIWYLDVPKVVIALPEITTQNMQGFLNSENKIRRLDNKDDMLILAKIIEEKYLHTPISPVTLNGYVDDLIEDYSTALKSRNTVQVIKSHNVIYPNKDGIYTTTVIDERDTKNAKYRCLKIDGILPTGEPYKNDETHWLLLDSSVYSTVSIGDKVTFEVSSICPLRDFSDLKHTRNIYVKQLLAI